MHKVPLNHASSDCWDPNNEMTAALTSWIDKGLSKCPIERKILPSSFHENTFIFITWTRPIPPISFYHLFPKHPKELWDE